MKNKIVILFCLSSICPFAVWGQNNIEASQGSPEEKGTIEHTAHKVMAATNKASEWLSSVSSVSLTSTEGETDMTGTIAINFLKLNTLLNINVNVPFDNSLTEALNLQELANEGSVEMGIEHNCWKLAKVRYSASAAANAFDEINKKREKDPCCDKKNINANRYLELDEEEKALFLKILHPRFNLPFWGVGYKIGRTDFDYFDDTTMITYSTAKTYYSNEVRAYAGIRFSARSSIGASFALNYYYDAGDAATYNIPNVKNPSVTEQIALYPIPPELKSKATVQLEYRQIFESEKFGINPTFKMDLVNGNAELRMQLYFLTLKEDGKAKGLNGGIFAGYRTGDDYKMNNDNGKFLLGIFFSGLFDVNNY